MSEQIIAQIKDSVFKEWFEKYGFDTEDSEFDKEAWTEYVQKLGKDLKENKSYETECSVCELNYNKLNRVNFIYKTHKYDMGYGDGRSFCDTCFSAFKFGLIPYCDYIYRGILVDDGNDTYTYVVDYKYYLESKDKNSNKYLKFYTNCHWYKLDNDTRELLYDYFVLD